MKRLFLAVLLAISVTTAAAAADYGGKASAATLARAQASWDGRTLPAYPAGPPEISILKVTIPPGAELPLHLHPVINAGYMLRGALTVLTPEGETLHLKAGDPIVEVVDKAHYGRNEGAEPVEIVVFYAGCAGCGPLTVPVPAAPLQPSRP